VGFTVEGVASSAVARTLAYEGGVFLSHGHFYAANVTRVLGLGPKAWSGPGARATRQPMRSIGW
jgi:selenocysteine lyase/cysteine desulfurase